MIRQGGVKIQEQVIQKIAKLCPPVPPETGGYIGKKADTICEFEFDPGIVQTNAGIYVPDVIRLNAVMEKWNDKGISFCGILHTHLPGQELPSAKDRKFISDIMVLNDRLFESLYFPIVIPGQGIYLYQAIRKKKGNAVEIVETDFYPELDVLRAERTEGICSNGSAKEILRI